MDNRQTELLSHINRNSAFPDIQDYVKKVLDIRGFNGQSAQDKLLLLTEETGELAKAVRKAGTDIAIDESRIKNYDSVESEAADVFIVLLSLCNELGIDLFDAFYSKEMVNVTRNWTHTQT